MLLPVNYVLYVLYLRNCHRVFIDSIYNEYLYFIYMKIDI